MNQTIAVHFFPIPKSDRRDSGASAAVRRESRVDRHVRRLQEEALILSVASAASAPTSA